MQEISINKLQMREKSILNKEQLEKTQMLYFIAPHEYANIPSSNKYK